jgi:CheY-like chemotaxis protein
VPPVPQQILLVDDDAAVRQFIFRALTSAGHRVVAVSSGQEALAAANKLSTIDVIVTDVVMPGMMGGAVARSITHLFPEARVLLVSGYLDDASVIPHVATGQWGYLAKPFTIRELCDAVDHLIRARPVMPRTSLASRGHAAGGRVARTPVADWLT